MLVATLNEPVPLRLLAADGRSDLYGQIRIYNDLGTLVFALSADHMNEGLYSTAWTPSLEGHYTMVGELYFDVLRTIEAGYEKVADSIEVNTIKTSLNRILGLQHENTYIDAQTYDGQKNLLSARVRLYDNPVNASAGEATGVIATYSMVAVYDSESRLTSYKMLIEP